MRSLTCPHLTPAQVDALDGAPVLDGDDDDQFIVDVRDGRAVYDAALLEARDRDWFWFNTVASLPSMGPRAPLLRWPDGSIEGDGEDEDAG